MNIAATGIICMHGNIRPRFYETMLTKTGLAMQITELHESSLFGYVDV